ncbi:hypothetical protein [Streptomyces sp. NRRL F-2580]|uniref:hypothetical protein n=1 Tax=Streptomyces sp. NRRL F-2580 TaxID=1463841 RepID=UPI00131D5C8F|nr:hypothetical protein [Streptomyces sp. NRRL F-2580]
MQDGGALWGCEGPVEGVVDPRCAEVGLEADVGGVLDDPQIFQLGSSFAGHGLGPVGSALVGQSPPEQERPLRLYVLVRDV